MNKIFSFFNSIINLLPDSPFKNLDYELGTELLGYVNWFLPFNNVINIMRLWTSAILGFYTYKLVKMVINKFLLKK